MMSVTSAAHHWRNGATEQHVAMAGHHHGSFMFGGGMGENAVMPNMLPFDPLGGLYAAEPPKPRYIFKMPRVVPDQKSKFESDDLFRRLSRESEVRYTGYRDRPMEERQMRFQNGCREGHIEIAFTTNGTNLQLVFSPSGYISNSNSQRECDFDKEPGKVHIRSPFIMNGVCVRWRGWLDLERLDGVGCLEYDDEQGQIEEALLREQIERYSQMVREFEDRQKAYRTAEDDRMDTSGSHSRQQRRQK